MSVRLGTVERTERVLSPAFSLLWLYSMLTSLAWAALFPALPLLVKGPLDGGDVAVGFVMSGAMLISAALQPVIGVVGDRRGRRLLVVAGPLWFASFVGLFTFAESPEALFALRTIAGIGDAAFIVGALTLVSDLAPPGRQGEAYSIFSLSTWVGMGLGPVVADAILNHWSFDAVWGWCVALSLLGAVCGTLLPETPRVASRASPPRGFTLSRAALAPGIVLALEMVGFVSLFVFGPLYARELGMHNGGTVLAVASAVLVLIRVFGRTIPDRLGSHGGALTGLLFVIGGLGLAASVQHPVALFVGGAGMGVGHALAYPALFMLAISSTAEHERSSALGTLKACESLGFAGSAAGLGVVAAIGGYAMVFAAGAGTALIGVVALSRLRHKEE